MAEGIKLNDREVTRSDRRVARSDRKMAGEDRKREDNYREGLRERIEDGRGKSR